MINVQSILNEFNKNNLLNDNSLLMLKIRNKKVVYNYKGQETNSPLFKHINANCGIFTSGEYSRTYSELGTNLKMTIEDGVEQFGSVVKCFKRNPFNTSIIKDNGFLLKADSLEELINNAKLLEHICKIELLGSKKGYIFRLNPVISFFRDFINKFHKLTEKVRKQ